MSDVNNSTENPVVDKVIKDCVESVKEINKKENSVVAYVSTITKDSYKEVVLPVFDLKRFQKNPVVLWSHEGYMPPIGKSLWQKADDTGLLAKTRFTVKTDAGMDVWTLFVEEILKAFSIGYRPIKRIRPDDPEWQQLLEQWGFDQTANEIHAYSELFEYSAVSVPANPDAVTNALRDEMVTSERIKTVLENWLVKQIKTETEETFTNATDEIKAELAKIWAAVQELQTVVEVQKRLPLYEEILQLEKIQKTANRLEDGVHSLPEAQPVNGADSQTSEQVQQGVKVLGLKDVMQNIDKDLDGITQRITGKH